ncbi:TfuA-like protein [Legionella sp. 16cNR16C]|uniref:TfuA-like protein n=1 Tax=Legionella sp. 16cNR16C TaxID=2905656 RepID=UPI001E2CA286|nr:TfuA-like protein [Legionella sp. 16cNR16C]MCE3045427.1 TfuA domain-containing protein [Legionella sp. 16cNR16C]
MIIDRAIFIESTLSDIEIKKYLTDSDLILPSIRRGHLLSLYSSYPSIKEVVIVDGVFEQQPSITHKEILWLLSRGIKVVGISSVGALRAFELRKEGMLGFGWVYEQFLNNYVDGDDEVAVSYDPLEPFNSRTLAMINFRKTAQENNELQNYLSVIKNIHFKERTWETLSTYLTSDILAKFRKLYIDIKKEDVVNYFRYVAEQRFPSITKFIPNIYFNSAQQMHSYISVLEFIRDRIEQSNTVEYPVTLSCKDDYLNICKLLALSPDYVGRIAFILQKFSGVSLNKDKIKSFTTKLKTELNLHSTQAIHDYFDKNEIPILKVTVLLENLTKLFDYFLCTLN